MPYSLLANEKMPNYHRFLVQEILSKIPSLLHGGFSSWFNTSNPHRIYYLNMYRELLKKLNFMLMLKYR